MYVLDEIKLPTKYLHDKSYPDVQYCSLASECCQIFIL